MGRLIDVDDLRIALGMGVLCGNKTAIQLINEAPIVEAIPKADYENRLKADMVDMLEEIQIEASNIYPTIHNCCSFTEGIMAYDKLIQQKINSLKEYKNGN